jgi:hypothetical protein
MNFDKFKQNCPRIGKKITKNHQKFNYALEDRNCTDWINPHLALPLISAYINIPKTSHALEYRNWTNWKLEPN